MIGSASEHLTTSPIFPCRQLTGQQPVVGSSSKSGTVTKFEDTNRSSSGASPWLSKEHGISNVRAAVKTAAHTVYEFIQLHLFR